MNKNKIVKSIINTIYFALVLAGAITISTMSLTRKINSYQLQKEPLIFHVEKETIDISNPASGSIDSVFVKDGQHVQKGDILVQLSDSTANARLQSLESVQSQNLSAKTEASVLKAQASQYQIRAPRDGVIYKVSVNEGVYVNQNTTLMTMFGDSDVKLIGYVDALAYADIQNNRNVEVYSPRFQQIYSLSLDGVGRVIKDEQTSESKYELQFRFKDIDEGSAFLQGEGLEVVSARKDIIAIKPADRVAAFWNGFISGK